MKRASDTTPASSPLHRVTLLCEFSATPPLPLLLQAKILCTFQGHLNLCNSMGLQEMRQRLERLKRSIHRVHLYARGEAQSQPTRGLALFCFFLFLCWELNPGPLY